MVSSLDDHPPSAALNLSITPHPQMDRTLTLACHQVLRLMGGWRLISVTAPPVQRTSDASLHFTLLHHSNNCWRRQRYTVRCQLLNTDTSNPFAHKIPSTLASRLPSGQHDWDGGALEVCTTSDRRAWAHPSGPRRTPARLAAQLWSLRAYHFPRTPR